LRRRRQDLLHRLLPDWSLRLALKVGLRREVVLPRQVLLAVVAVAAPAAGSLQVVAVLAQPAAELRRLDSWAPEPPD